MDEITGDRVLNISELPLPLLTECFNRLSPRDLACSSAVCTTWQRAVSTQPWHRFFNLHFGSVNNQDEEEDHQHDPSYWMHLYNKKMHLTSQCWKTSTFPPCDLLHNVHSDDIAGVKTCKLVHGGTYVYTGGLDRRISCWNLHTGMLQCTSSLHAGTIRRLAADEKALVSAASDKRIRLFPAATPPSSSSTTTTSTTDWYYDITATDSRRLVSDTLQGHTGPISALALTPTTIISGSWDYTIKIWDRQDLSAPIQSITLDDWIIDCVLVCNKRLLHVVTTASVLSFAITATGYIASHVPLFSVLDSTFNLVCMAATEDGGWLMFSGGSGVVAVDLRRRKKMVLATSLSLPQQRQSAVSCMHWEYPQLAAGTAGGNLVLLDLEKLIQANTKTSSYATSSGLPYEEADAMVASGDTIVIKSTEKIPSGICTSLGPYIMVPHRKIPTTMASKTSIGGSGGGGPTSAALQQQHQHQRQQHSIQSIDRYNGWLVAGFGNGSILTWDGRAALERQYVVDKSKVGRRTARLARKIDNGKGKKGGGQGEDEKSSSGQRVLNELKQEEEQGEEGEGEKEQEEREEEEHVHDDEEIETDVGNCVSGSGDHDGDEPTRPPLSRSLSPNPTINDDDDDDLLVAGSSRRKKQFLNVPGPITALITTGDGDGGARILREEGPCRQEAWHVLQRKSSSSTVPPPPL